MKLPLARDKKVQPKLAARLMLVLSIAIMPLGLISVYQTHRVLQERQSLSETALLGRTEQAVSESRKVIQKAFTSAETLAILLTELPPGDGTCDALMQRVVQSSDQIVFAGYNDDALGLVCSSKPGGVDLEVPLPTAAQLEQLHQNVTLRPFAFLGGIATLGVTAPVVSDGQVDGSVWVAVSISALNEALSTASDDVDLVLFQPDGELIATDDFGDDRRSVLPETQLLADLARQGGTSFRGRNRHSNIRDFAVSPIVEGRIFALGSWEPQHRGIMLPAYEAAMALYFPLAIWVIAIAVAYVGVHRLVIRHVRQLREWMRQYSRGDIDLDQARLDDAPEELEVVAEAFRAMTRRLSEQDRRREEDIREKTVLLREVHHRVKNNLQLISSMLNMQIRATDIAEARSILRRVQDRVLALSAIHRYLYLARKLSLVRADELLQEIIQQLVIVGTLDETNHRIQLTTDLDPVEISPDQSVPLSLLATEAAMNAVKYCGNEGDEPPWITIALKRCDDTDLCLSVSNSLGSSRNAEDEVMTSKGSGLGSRLIESFVMQLDGALDIRALPQRYELHVVFPIVQPGDEAFVPEG